MSGENSAPAGRPRAQRAGRLQRRPKGPGRLVTRRCQTGSHGRGSDHWEGVVGIHDYGAWPCGGTRRASARSARIQAVCNGLTR